MKFLRNQINKKMRVGLILLPVQVKIKVTDKKRKKTMMIIKISKKNCSKDSKTRVTFILKKTYFL